MVNVHPAVRMVVSSTLTICFGLGSRDYTLGALLFSFSKSFGFRMHTQNVGLSFGLGLMFWVHVLGLGFGFKLSFRFWV